MTRQAYAEIAYAGRTVRIEYVMDGGPQNRVALVDDGIDGWWDSPDLKVTQVERVTGDGAHDVPESDVLYSARTVTLHLGVVGEDRDQMIAMSDDLRACLGHDVRLRVVDGDSDTYVYGHTSLKVEAEVHYRSVWHMNDLTVVCPRPERLSTSVSRGIMLPGATATDGLVYSTDGVLQWPLCYGATGAEGNACTVTNAGTHVAMPVITASGDMPEGFTLTDTATGAQLAYGGAVTWQPLTLDCRTRTASVAGVDVTRRLSARGWPSVTAGGSLTLALDAAGTGQVEVTCHDTYI